MLSAKQRLRAKLRNMKQRRLPPSSHPAPTDLVGQAQQIIKGKGSQQQKMKEMMELLSEVPPDQQAELQHALQQGMSEFNIPTPQEKQEQVTTKKKKKKKKKKKNKKPKQMIEDGDQSRPMFC